MSHDRIIRFQSGRMRQLVLLFAAMLFQQPRTALAQQAACADGFAIEGVITDPSGALIPGAEVRTADGGRTVTDTAGHYKLPCVRLSTSVVVQANGFKSTTAPVARPNGRAARLDLTLELANVETSVEVHDDATTMDTDHGAGTQTLSAAEVHQMADDPDDFMRQLEALAAGAGGAPGAADITVDGFQNASALPPKSSIASIRVNPDLFSGEYERAPYLGGRIEILTKPGADPLHGAVFFNDSDSIWNATDPLSVMATPAGKRRYGFELSGPVLPKKIDFALALEKRDIDEFNIVRAITLGADGSPVPFQQAVSAPQRLWIGSARADWQVSPKDTTVLTFSANVNNLQNQGVGGLILPEAGYSSAVSEYDLRLNNTWTLGPNLLHETRVGLTWARTAQTPLSQAPSLQVSGYFTGGGATSQNLNNREKDLEVDDDLMGTQGKHTWKVGVQSLGVFVHDYDPNTFNGAYLFGGGSAPVLDANNQPTGQTTSISGIEQYRRALVGLPGGSPTTYQVTRGEALVPLTQWRVGLYAQDAIKLAPRFSALAAFRYQLQTTPWSFVNLSPRAGLAWSPDRKSAWTVHLRGGIFHVPNPRSYATEVYRLNGSRQQETTVYSPLYADPLAPVPGAIQVSTRNQFPRQLNQLSSFETHVSIEHTLRNQLHLAATDYWWSAWGRAQLRNVNAPMVASSAGEPVDPTAALLAPRPLAANENIFSYDGVAHARGNAFVFEVNRNAGRFATFSVAYVRVNDRENAGDTLDSPQSSYSNAGESSPPEWESVNQVWSSGTLHLPWKAELATRLDAHSGQPFNITTGTDANGDGVFNDRPAYASSAGVGVYQTRYGLLSANAVNGDVPKNLGWLPALVHLDTTLSRVFQLNGKDKDHVRTLELNARSANLLNHTNVTGVNSVLSSSFGEPVAAETARRLELGMRFSF